MVLRLAELTHCTRFTTQSRFLVESVAAPFVAAATALAITHPIDTARVRISMNYYRNPKEMLFTGVTSCWSLIRLEESNF